MTKARIGVHGACGRMGRMLIAGVHRDPACQVWAALEHDQHPDLGKDIGEIVGLGAVGVMVSSKIPDRVDALIDFSTPEATLENAKKCAARQIPLVIGTTGFSKQQRDELLECHHETALLLASNCSLVVNTLFALVGQAAQILKGKDFDVEIVERHHRFKVDAPSGTALTFADIIQKEMGQTKRCHGREGITGERGRDEIGLHAVRTGDNVGEHTIIFSTMGETLELVHRGHSRESYAKGAVEAAKYLAGKKPGRYTMANVLGLD